MENLLHYEQEVFQHMYETKHGHSQHLTICQNFMLRYYKIVFIEILYGMMDVVYWIVTYILCLFYRWILVKKGKIAWETMKLPLSPWANLEVSSSTTKTQIYWLIMKQLLFMMNGLLYNWIMWYTYRLTIIWNVSYTKFIGIIFIQWTG